MAETTLNVLNPKNQIMASVIFKDTVGLINSTSALYLQVFLENLF